MRTIDRRGFFGTIAALSAGVPFMPEATRNWLKGKPDKVIFDECAKMPENWRSDLLAKYDGPSPLLKQLERLEKKAAP